MIRKESRLSLTEFFFFPENATSSMYVFLKKAFFSPSNLLYNRWHDGQIFQMFRYFERQVVADVPYKVGNQLEFYKKYGFPLITLTPKKFCLMAKMAILGMVTVFLVVL